MHLAICQCFYMLMWKCRSNYSTSAFFGEDIAAAIYQRMSDAETATVANT